MPRTKKTISEDNIGCLTPLDIKVKKLHPDAKLPHRAHSTDSGADLLALAEPLLPPRSITNVRTGVAVELHEGTSGCVWGKSSVESKGVKVMAGLIDAPYRGEILVCMYNLNDIPFKFEKGQKIGEAVYKLNGEIIGQTDIIAGEKVKKMNFINSLSYIFWLWFTLNR